MGEFNSDTSEFLMQRLIQITKWVWLIALVIGVGWYLNQNFTAVVVEIRKVSPLRIVGSFALLITGRLLMMQVARDALKVLGFRQTYHFTFRTMALSELGKYLPGGIWHFVGRAGYYRNAGLNIGESTSALFLEHFWMVVSTAIGGCMLLLIYANAASIGLILVLFVSLWLLIIRITVRQAQQKFKLRDVIRLLMLQLAIWFSLGISFWILLPAASENAILLTIGAFAISWLIGFLTVLAPGGLGTREATLVILLLPLFAAQTIVILASIHRLLWISFEILTLFVALLLDSWKRSRICIV